MNYFLLFFISPDLLMLQLELQSEKSGLLFGISFRISLEVQCVNFQPGAQSRIAVDAGNIFSCCDMPT